MTKREGEYIADVTSVTRKVDQCQTIKQTKNLLKFIANTNIKFISISNMTKNEELRNETNGKTARAVNATEIVNN